MPLHFPGFGSSSGSGSANPQIRQLEKHNAKDTRVDQKNLDHTTRDVKKAEKTHQKAVKAVDQAQHDLDKAVSQQHKAASALNKAQQEHDASIADEESAEKALSINRQHEARLEQDLGQRRATMDEFQRRKDVNDQFRETKLSEAHADEASRAGSRINSMSTGPGVPTGPGSGSGSKPNSIEGQQQGVNENGELRSAEVASPTSLEGPDTDAGPSVM